MGKSNSSRARNTPCSGRPGRFFLLPEPGLLGICLLALLAGLFPQAVPAAELKTSGEFQVSQNLNSHWSFQSSRQGAPYQDADTIDQRLRLSFDFVASDDLKAVMELQFGTNSWGQGGLALGQGDATTAGSFGSMVRQIYIDAAIPDTRARIKVGYMDFALASGFAGSPVLEDSSAGVAMLTLPLAGEDVAATVGYLRLWDTFNATGHVPPRDCHMDGAFATLPLVLSPSVTLTPYALVAWGGRNSLSTAVRLSEGEGDAGKVQGLLTPGLTLVEEDNGLAFGGSVSAWWAGLAGKFKLTEDLWLAADLIHGRMNQGWRVNERQGWFTDLGLGVKGATLAGATFDPMVFFAWSGGEDANIDNGSERMPVLDNYLSLGSFYFTGSAFGPGDMGNQNDQMGFWTLGLSLKHITWFEGLSHDVHVLYIRGTNSHELLENPALPHIRQWDGDFSYLMGSRGGFLTDRDSLWEFDLNTSYKVFEKLTAVLELGYIKQAMNQETWNAYFARGGAPSADSPRFKGVDAQKLALGLIYEF